MSAPEPDAPRVADRKRLARLQALAALKGYTVEAIDGDDGSTQYIVMRWSLTRRAATLDDLEQLLARMGVAV